MAALASAMSYSLTRTPLGRVLVFLDIVYSMMCSLQCLTRLDLMLHRNNHRLRSAGHKGKSLFSRHAIRNSYHEGSRVRPEGVFTRAERYKIRCLDQFVGCSKVSASCLIQRQRWVERTCQ